MTAEALLDRLEGVKQTSPDQWVARCPAHEDKHPSLSIAETADGVILLHCFSGCGIESIVSAIGLNLSDLFPPMPEAYGGGRPVRRRPDYKALWMLTRRSVLILSMAVDDIANGRPLSTDDLAAVRRAREHIFGVMEVLDEG
jgi:hypothetical protein